MAGSARRRQTECTLGDALNQARVTTPQRPVAMQPIANQGVELDSARRGWDAMNKILHKFLKITIPKFTLVLLAFLCVALAPPAHAQTTEKRMALVIGTGASQTGALATPANDAGLIAQTLQAAGFDVVGARDLDEDSLRHAFR